MPCFFSVAVSAMMLSSNVARISPSSGSSTPVLRSAASSAQQIPAIAPSNAHSCRRTFLISAELSAGTSVVVFTYPTFSRSK